MSSGCLRHPQASPSRFTRGTPLEYMGERHFVGPCRPRIKRNKRASRAILPRGPSWVDGSTEDRWCECKPLVAYQCLSMSHLISWIRKSSDRSRMCATCSRSNTCRVHAGRIHPICGLSMPFSPKSFVSPKSIDARHPCAAERWHLQTVNGRAMGFGVAKEWY